MNKLISKLSAGVVSAAIIGSSLAMPVFAQDIAVTGNGSNSTNLVKVDNGSSTDVHQSSTTNAGVFVNSNANTGGNKANNNTGGDTSISTGDATSTVGVTVEGGSNTATVNPCGCATGSANITISGNGTGSYNKVKQNNSSNQTVKQKAKVNALVGVDSTAKTGKNKTNNNTGGSVGTTTGSADSAVLVGVVGGSNTVNP